MPTAAELTRITRERRVTDSGDLLRNREKPGVTRDITLPFYAPVFADVPAFVRERGGLLSNLVMPERTISGPLALTTSDGRRAEVVVDEYQRRGNVTRRTDRRPTGVTLTQTRVGADQYVVDIEQRRTAKEIPARERVLVEAESGDAALGDALGYLTAKQLQLQVAGSLDIFVDEQMLLGMNIQIFERATIAVTGRPQMKDRQRDPKVTPIPATAEYAAGSVDNPRMLIPAVRHAATFEDAATARALTGEELAGLDRTGTEYRDAVMAGVRAEVHRIFMDPTAELKRYRTETARQTKTVAQIPGEKSWETVVASITTNGAGEVVEYSVHGNEGRFPTAIEVRAYRRGEPHVSTRSYSGYNGSWWVLGGYNEAHEQSVMRRLGVTPREVAPVAVPAA